MPVDSIAKVLQSPVYINLLFWNMPFEVLKLTLNCLHGIFINTKTSTLFQTRFKIVLSSLFTEEVIRMFINMTFTLYNMTFF